MVVIKVTAVVETVGTMGATVTAPLTVMALGPPVPPGAKVELHPVVLPTTRNVMEVRPLNPELGKVTEPACWPEQLGV